MSNIDKDKGKIKDSIDQAVEKTQEGIKNAVMGAFKFGEAWGKLFNTLLDKKSSKAAGASVIEGTQDTIRGLDATNATLGRKISPNTKPGAEEVVPIMDDTIGESYKANANMKIAPTVGPSAPENTENKKEQEQSKKNRI